MTPLSSESAIGGFAQYWAQAGEALSTQLIAGGVLVRVGGAMFPRKTDKIRNVLGKWCMTFDGQQDGVLLVRLVTSSQWLLSWCGNRRSHCRRQAVPERAVAVILFFSCSAETHLQACESAGMLAGGPTRRTPIGSWHAGAAMRGRMDLVPLQDIAPRTFWAASMAAVACTMPGRTAAVSPDHSPPRPCALSEWGCAA
jgi:hypothetical protein